MTFDPKEARALVERLLWLEAQYRDAGRIIAEDFKEAAETLAAALDEIERLREALDLIATHRKKCWHYDDDMDHPRRDFDREDVKLMENAARAALKGDDQ